MARSQPYREATTETMGTKHWSKERKRERWVTRVKCWMRVVRSKPDKHFFFLLFLSLLIYVLLIFFIVSLSVAIWTCLPICKSVGTKCEESRAQGQKREKKESTGIDLVIRSHIFHLEIYFFDFQLKFSLSVSHKFDLLWLCLQKFWHFFSV